MPAAPENEQQQQQQPVNARRQEVNPWQRRNPVPDMQIPIERELRFMRMQLVECENHRIVIQERIAILERMKAEEERRRRQQDGANQPRENASARDS